MCCNRALLWLAVGWSARPYWTLNLGQVLLPQSRASVRPPFLHLSPSKNEVPPVQIHRNKSIQHQIFPVYWPSQQSTNISPILELYVRQVRHWKFLRFCLDNANKAESILPQLFSSRHWCEVWVCANDPVRVSLWHHKLLQHFCTMREIVSVILLIFLILRRLHNPEQHHNPWPPACSILDLRPILRLPVYCHIHWKTQIDPMTTLSVLPWYGLISTYEIRRRE